MINRKLELEVTKKY